MTPTDRRSQTNSMATYSRATKTARPLTPHRPLEHSTLQSRSFVKNTTTDSSCAGCRSSIMGCRRHGQHIFELRLVVFGTCECLSYFNLQNVVSPCGLVFVVFSWTYRSVLYCFFSTHIVSPSSRIALGCIEVWVSRYHESNWCVSHLETQV